MRWDVYRGCAYGTYSLVRVGITAHNQLHVRYYSFKYNEWRKAWVPYNTSAYVLVAKNVVFK